MSERERALKLFERAYECQRVGNFDDAIRFYRESIAMSPTSEAHTFLGWVFALQRRYDDAILECKRAIAVDPTLGNPYNDIGAYLMQLDRDEEAIAWFHRAIEAPRYEATHFPHVNLARIYERRGDLLAALAELTRASDKMPDHPPIIAAIRRLQARVN